jgi:hypothetical protein
MKSSQEVIAKASESVDLVEARLNELSRLEEQAQELSDGLTQLKLYEADLLAGDKSESQKVSALTKLRIAAEVKASELKKLQSEIGAATEETIALAIASDRWLSAIRDGVSAARRTRVLAEVGAYFDPACALELKRLVGFALAVKEVEDHPRFTWVSSRPEMSLSNAKKLRQTFDHLSSLAESEPGVEFITSEAFEQPVPRQPIVGDKFAYAPTEHLL